MDNNNSSVEQSANNIMGKLKALTEVEKGNLISKLTKKEKFALDSYLISKQKALCYEVSRDKPSTASKPHIYSMANAFFRKLEVQVYLMVREQDLTDGCFFSDKYFNDIAISTKQMKHIEGERKDGKLFEDGKFSLEFGQNGVDLDKEKAAEMLKSMIVETKDVKLQSELLVKLSDLMGWKKVQQLEENNTTLFYLPLKCSNCKFKLKKR